MGSREQGVGGHHDKNAEGEQAGCGGGRRRLLFSVWQWAGLGLTARIRRQSETTEGRAMDGRGLQFRFLVRFVMRGGGAWKDLQIGFERDDGTVRRVASI